MSRKVNFSRENDRSDSGIGSDAHQGSYESTSRPGRTGAISTAETADLETRDYDIRTLQEALEDARKFASHYKKKAERIDADLVQTRKDLREKEAQWRGMFDRCEDLEDENKKLVLEKRELHRSLQNSSLENEDLKVKLRDALQPVEERDPNQEPKLLRVVKKKTDADKKKEKERLSKRFERPDDDDTSGRATTSPPRRSRSGYLEPWGPAEPGNYHPHPLPPKSSIHNLGHSIPMRSPYDAKLQEENDALRAALREALTHSLREALCTTMTSYKIRHATSKVESADELKKRFAGLLVSSST